MSIDAARLTAVISPLRRALLSAARAAERLPEIPDAQVEVIRALPAGTTTSPGELASTLGVGRSTISNLLASMERSGLVSRTRRDDDRRSIDVQATREALDLFSRFDRASIALLTNAVSTLSAADQRALTEAVPALERLLAAVRLTGRDTPEENTA